VRLIGFGPNQRTKGRNDAAIFVYDVTIVLGAIGFREQTVVRASLTFQKALVILL
jgi:hypothetical protein